MLDSVFNSGLALLSAAIPLSIAAISLLFFPLLSLWILGFKWTFKRWPPTWGSIEKCFAIFFAASALSACCGINIHHGFYEIWKKDFYFFVYALFLAGVQERSQGERFMMIFWVSSILAGLLGVVQFGLAIATHFYPSGAIANFLVHGPSGLIKLLQFPNGRASGPRSHSIRYSEGLLFALTLSIAFLGSGKKEDRWKWIFGAWILAAGILVSQTRGTWLALIVIMGLVVIMDRKRLNIGHALLVLVPVGFLISMTGFRARFESIWSRDLGSNVERLHMWHAGWEVYKQHPILGVGPGNIRPVVAIYEVGDEKLGGGWGHLHNIFVTFAAERGTLGLAGLLILMGSFASPLWKTIHQADVDPTLRAYCLSAFLGLVGFLLCGLTEMDYNNADVLVTFYFVME